MLEKKERDLQRKMSVEVEKAKGFLQARNKRGKLKAIFSPEGDMTHL